MYTHTSNKEKNYVIITKLNSHKQKRLALIILDFYNYKSCSKCPPWASAHFWVRWCARSPRSALVNIAYGTMSLKLVMNSCNIVNHSGGSVLYSHLHCCWNSTTFSVLQYHFKIAFHCSNDNLSSILMLLINLSHSNTNMMNVSLICLPEHHTTHYCCFWVQLWNIWNRYLLSKCLYISSARSV